MAGTVYISEAEAARDFAAVVDRALAGEEIVVRRGVENVILLSPVRRATGRPIADVIAALGQPGSTGLAMPDEDFAADVGSVREGWGTPVDTIRGKTAGEVIQAFARWEAQHGKLTVDNAFAEDVMDGHRIFNQPLDGSKWD